MYQNSTAGQRRNPMTQARLSLFLAVFAVLPVIGLVAGPSYAPLLFGLAGLSLLVLLAERAERFSPDLLLIAVALLFLAVCAAGLADTFSPRLTQERVIQMAGICVACLALLSLPRLPAGWAERLAQLMFWFVVLGVAVLGADTAFDYPLQHALGGPAPNIGTKYNRGIIALVILTWPIVANLSARGERGKAQLAFGFVMLGCLVGLSATGLLSLVVGFFVFLVALKAPGFARGALGGGMSGLALALPWLLRFASGHRDQLASYVKWTGIHRLEIWDYMSARILERPLAGWGLGTAKVVPIRAEELANYLYADATGIYPHNQWIELWLETGFPSILLALALLWLVLRRAQGRWAAYRLAAVASALTASLLNFEVTTDSWWACLAASALLFRQLPAEPEA